MTPSKPPFNGTSGQQVSLRVTNSTLAGASVSLIWPDQTTHYLGSFGTGASLWTYSMYL